MTLTPDTPDFQRGVVSAQVFLAEIAPFTGGHNVDIPPNAETLIVVVPESVPSDYVTVEGLTTGVQYPGVPGVEQPGAVGFLSIYFDVSSVMDDVVSVSLAAPFSTACFIYADSGVHLVGDYSKRSNQVGQQWVIGSVNSGHIGDRPINEMTLFSIIAAGSGTVIASPGTLFALRIVGLNMSTPTAGTSGYVSDADTGLALLSCAGPGNASLDIPDQGYPITVNAGLDYTLAAGVGDMTICVFYTLDNWT